MHRPSNNDYINWLRIQDGQLTMEEFQLAAEQQRLYQQMWEHNNNTNKRVGEAILYAVGKIYRPTPWQRTASWLATNN